MKPMALDNRNKVIFELLDAIKNILMKRSILACNAARRFLYVLLVSYSLTSPIIFWRTVILLVMKRKQGKEIWENLPLSFSFAALLE